MHNLPILRLRRCAALAGAVLIAAVPTLADNPHGAGAVTITGAELSYGAGATSIEVHGMRKGQADGPKDSKPLRQLKPGGSGGNGGSSGSSDPVVQSAAYTSTGSVSLLSNFEGLGNGFSGFSVDSAPPDTNGAAGTTQYVQWVNESFEVFDKSGNPLEGPVPGNQLFQSLGSTHPCAVNNDGDPIAQYDKLNRRWILTQFSVTNGSSQGYWQCIAVSQADDATGKFNVYAFRQPNFNDYPKLGVWNGNYYITYNMFSGNSFVGSRLCAYDAAAMRNGTTTAAEQCFQLSNAYGGVLPADVDGATQPAGGTGASEYFLNFGTNSLNVWRFNLNLANAGSSSLSGPYNTTVANFTEACGGGSCIPQPGTRQQLDSLADRPMYRLSYRNISGTESLYVNHSVNPGSVASGVRWYQLRISSTTGTSGISSIVQQSTFAPSDGLSRWMGSIASDKQGNIAIGYSTSSGSINPAIHLAYRIPGDTPSKMGSEHLVYQGNGSQLQNLNRWGDYSAMSVDPSDDCTFWYTNEYIPSNGTFNWHTRIQSFRVNGCT